MKLRLKYLQQFEQFIINNKDPNKEKEPKKKPKVEPKTDENEPVPPKEDETDPIEEMKAYFDKQNLNRIQWKSII
jgi:hypothetical protein